MLLKGKCISVMVFASGFATIFHVPTKVIPLMKQSRPLLMQLFLFKMDPASFLCMIKNIILFKIFFFTYSTHLLLFIQIIFLFVGKICVKYSIENISSPFVENAFE